MSKWWRLSAIAGFWLTMLAVLFTYSRGAWLGLGAVAALVFLQSKRKILTLAVLVPLGMSAIALIPERVFLRADTIGEYQEDSSAMQRLQGWGVAWNVATRHPLGSGFTLDATPVDVWMSYANFHRPDFNRANAAHSIYFQILGDHGFLGLALFLFTLVGTMLTLVRIRIMAGRDPERAWLGHYASALLIGLVGYSISGAFVSLAYFDLFYFYVISSAILLREVKAPVGSPVTGAAKTDPPIGTGTTRFPKGAT
jgi:probable O-glycosylation ligase (exosortase A-associated)